MKATITIESDRPDFADRIADYVAGYRQRAQLDQRISQLELDTADRIRQLEQERDQALTDTASLRAERDRAVAEILELETEAEAANQIVEPLRIRTEEQAARINQLTADLATVSGQRDRALQRAAGLEAVPPLAAGGIVRALPLGGKDTRIERVIPMPSIPPPIPALPIEIGLCETPGCGHPKRLHTQEGCMDACPCYEFTKAGKR